MLRYVAAGFLVTVLHAAASGPLKAADLRSMPAQVSACFTPAESCVGAIVAAIAAAQTEIWVQAYSFTLPRILV